ncbi:MAG: NADH-quinone oxidoreductase subunit NuoN [Woeseiaceae bacterium]|nr:NADH-quinone oxidoreductase subunit NuoN [Woeseiaceae bacterium]NIP19603.1 NADH-quinone oxidoreductase subunit NuoN [Woeseiaceae bacterium]
MPDLQLAAAEIFLVSAICVVLVVDVFLSDAQRVVTFRLAMLSLVGTAVCSMYYIPDQAVTAFSESFILDPASAVMKIFAYLIVGLVFLYSRDYLIRAGLFKGEFFVLGLFGLLGIMVMLSAHSLLTLYLGLELLSLSLYSLVAFDRDSPIAAESAMKYFVLGAIASGTLLYGISILYGVTGTVQLGELSAHFAQPGAVTLPALLGLAFVVVGVAFKFGAVPFHMWLPDVYQGASTPVTAFVGSAPKIAAFALTWRVLSEGLGDMHSSWQDMLALLSVLSLAIGNIVAIAQSNIKRMLAYSTISHVGFILMGFVAGTDDGLQAAMFYTLVYSLMAAAAFGMIIVLSRKGFEADNLDDFKGLNARSPWLAFVMLMIMFSMAGVPPFVGFYAKLVVLGSVIDAGMLWLAIVGVLLAVVGAFYYLRVVWFMYFVDPVDDSALEAATDLRFVISANGLGLLVLGVFPGVLLNLCARLIS